MFNLEKVIDQFISIDCNVYWTEKMIYRNNNSFKRLIALQIHDIIKTDKNIYFNGMIINGMQNHSLFRVEMNLKELKKYISISESNEKIIEEQFKTIKKTVELML